MRISNIFALKKVREKLFSVQFEEDTPHAFEQLFDDWNDIEYLFDFFHDNILDLQNDFWQTVFDRTISVDEAIDVTLDHAEKIEKRILDLAKRNTTQNENNLDRLFVHLLKDGTFNSKFDAAYKAYGTTKSSWLRIYAIKIEDTYIITGGAIKLTGKMQDRLHTQQELDKLQNVASELKRNYFTNNSDFDFVYLEI
ncbi:hypothetical protein GCM10011514_10540 [Emticicia aquatilis]|uniref:Uncharacterized protein n=1 Tax=Emticicia aquatilis TaxID=1537369 RepID=A0A916YKQ0_9BACT|nr:hypothetical protein [Emticicia aquatilis]GGD48381.1 hypothetical protein GCM10011514_10540 [Emticicia aquatilis]